MRRQRGNVLAGEATRIRPDAMVSNPAIDRNKVVLPQPLGPSSDRNSPAATLSDTGPTTTSLL